MGNGNTVYDIARVAGVSRTTVMRALSDKPDVSAETKAKVKKIATELRYRPNYIARSLSLGRSRLIGVVADPTVARSFQAVILAAQRSLQKSGYGILYYASLDASYDGQRNCLEHMIQNRVEGVLAVPGHSAANTEAFRDLLETGAKVIVLDGCVEGISVPQVVPNNYKAGRLGIEHLVSLGHKDIVYMGMGATYFVGSERLRGVSDAMKDAGIPLNDETYIQVDCNEDMAAEVTTRLLARPNRPTAIFTRHDIVARGAMRAILDAGLSIPGDISLVGCGEMLDNDILRVPLTSVGLPGDQTIAMAVSKLVKMLKGSYVKPETTVLDAELVIRASTGPVKSRK